MGIVLSESCYLQDSCWKYMNDETAPCKSGNVFCPKFFRTNYLFDESLMSVKQRIHIPLRPDADGTDREEFIKLKKLRMASNHLLIMVNACTFILEFVGTEKQLGR